MIVFFRFLACCEKIHHGCVSCPVRKQVLEWEPLKLNQAECWKFAVYRAAFPCHFLHRIIRGFSASVVLNFESGWIPEVRPFKWKLLSSTFQWCTRWFELLSLWMNSQIKTTEQYFPVMLFITLNVWVCGWNYEVWSFNSRLLSNTFVWCCLLCCKRWL